MTDRNDLAFWFPPLEQAGLRVPKTKIVKYESPFDDLVDVLDGREPHGFAALLDALATAGDELESWPCFLRTGHTSGKHSWNDCCYVEEAAALPAHVCSLVEESHMGIPSLPTDTWVVRELIPTAPLFRCQGYRGFPVVREFRLFVRDASVEHMQPYWPEASIEDYGHPDNSDWRELLRSAGTIKPSDWRLIRTEALAAVAVVGGGYWSVDFLNDSDGGWWLIDMAEGDRSFRYES